MLSVKREEEWAFRAPMSTGANFKLRHYPAGGRQKERRKSEAGNRDGDYARNFRLPASDFPCTYCVSRTGWTFMPMSRKAALSSGTVSVV